jgi:hypothetical protein
MIRAKLTKVYVLDLHAHAPVILKFMELLAKWRAAERLDLTDAVPSIVTSQPPSEEGGGEEASEEKAGVCNHGKRRRGRGHW